MHPFTTVTLSENRPGTLVSYISDSGGVFDRDLFFTDERGETITIWDEGFGKAMAISTDLQPELRYRTLLCSVPEEQATASTVPLLSALPENHWEGRILDPQWQPPQDDYVCAIRDLATRTWVLVTSPIGSILLRDRVREQPLQVGDHVRWEPTRTFLCAVWRIAQPVPFITAALPTAEWQRGLALSPERQQVLTQRRQIVPDPANGQYPFAQMPLTRADIEWLLQTHQSASTSGIYAGPVVWDDPEQRDRPGLDLRGADLRGVDLSGLPLARLVGGLYGDAWNDATPAQRAQAAIHLEGAQLAEAHLEGALLRDAQMHEANLRAAHLASALLRSAQLDEAHLEQADLTQTMLSGANLRAAHLVAARLTRTDLILADLRGANLRQSVLYEVDGQGALGAGTNLQETQITRCFFHQAHLEEADFTHAQIVDTDLTMGGYRPI